MALSKQRVLKQVTVLPNISAVNVQWAIQVLDNNVLISETYDRKSYSIELKDQFLTEVDGAANYITALGW